MEKTRKYKTKNRKLFLQRRARKLHLRHVKWKEHRRNERRIRCEINYRRNRSLRKQVIHEYERNRFKNYSRRNAPENFSIIGNHEQVINFCNNLRDDYRRRRKVFVNLERVNKVTNESLGLLVSNMMLFQQQKIDFNGNFPIDERSKAIVIKSGFLEQLYKGKRNSVNNVGSSIYTHAAATSNAEVVGAIIESCSRFLWQESYYYDGVYNAIVELMLNTFEHANEIEGKQKWWLTVTKDEENSKCTFSFLDYGRGIITTLQDAQHKHHSTIVDKILSKFGSFTNRDAILLQEVLEGALVISEKDSAQYGNGLHSIYRDMVDNLLDNVIIITNNVYADLKNGLYQTMKVRFNGTFISMEINKNTTHGDLCSNSIYPDA